MAARRPNTPHVHDSRPQNGESPQGSAFTDLGVPAVLATALARQGIVEPFPIQSATLPDALAGRDVLGRGQTGSGKTLAFVLPVLARLTASESRRRSSRPRALILVPTRELASQIQATITPLADQLHLRSTTVFGGVGAGSQIAALRSGVDIVVACPGRLADLLQGGHVHLDAAEITVLDEADHMADLGFLPTVRRLLDQTPARAQRLLFSATLDAAVDVVVKRYLHNPVTHSVDDSQSAPLEIAHHVLHVSAADRLPVIVDLAAAPGRTVVFTRTKFRAKTLTRQLNAAGVTAVEMHGNLAQNARERNLAAFSDGGATTLVATDIAARGIHVDDVALVVHADPPIEHKAYLHRSGRTARAGASGTVVTIMTDDQVQAVRDLTRKAGISPTTTKVHRTHPLLTELAPGERIVREVRHEASRPEDDARIAREERSYREGPTTRRTSSGASAGRVSTQRPNRHRDGQPGSSRNGQPAVSRNGQPGGQAGAQPGGRRTGQASGQRTGQPSGQRNGQTNGQHGGPRAGQPAGPRSSQPAANRNGRPAGQRGSHNGSAPRSNRSPVAPTGR
jgi:superfamily II DNA/RNA helicase